MLTGNTETEKKSKTKFFCYVLYLVKLHIYLHKKKEKTGKLMTDISPVFLNIEEQKKLHICTFFPPENIKWVLSIIFKRFCTSVLFFLSCTMRTTHSTQQAPVLLTYCLYFCLSLPYVGSCRSSSVFTWQNIYVPLISIEKMLWKCNIFRTNDRITASLQM